MMKYLEGEEITNEELKAAINADAQKARAIVGLSRSDEPLTEMYG